MNITKGEQVQFEYEGGVKIGQVESVSEGIPGFIAPQAHVIVKTEQGGFQIWGVDFEDII